MTANRAPHTAEAVLSILSYCLSSILMIVTNKLVLSSYGFKMNFLLLAIQSLICVTMLESFKLFGLLKHRPFRAKEANQWFVVSLSLVLMIYSGSKAIQELPIPLFTIFKNVTIIAIAFCERRYFGGAKVTAMMLGAFALIVLSSVIAGWADLTSTSASGVGTLAGYFWMLANCISTCSFTLLIKSKIKTAGFKDFDTVFYNNVLSVPILLVLSACLEQAEGHRTFQRFLAVDAPENFYGLFIGILVSSVCSFGISYSTAWCVRVTSSTTYSIVGSLNKLPIAVAGMVFFDSVVNFGSVAGVFIGTGRFNLAFAGGLVYSYAKSSASVNLSLPTYEPVVNKEDK